MPSLFDYDLGDWKDPLPAPVVEEHDGFMIVRDDLLEGISIASDREWCYNEMGSKWYAVSDREKSKRLCTRKS